MDITRNTRWLYVHDLKHQARQGYIEDCTTVFISGSSHSCGFCAVEVSDT